MSGGSQQKSTLPMVSLVAIMAVTGGLVALKPLQSSRPADSAKTNFPVAVMADARLWEDPLEATYRHLKIDDEDIKWTTHDEHGIDLLLQTSAKTLFLPVMIQGGHNAGDHENRLRGRYAVLAALGADHYYPVDPTSVHYFGFRWDADPDSTIVGRKEILDPDNPAAAIPYEICVSDASEAEGEEYKQVVVLWVPDNALEDEPLMWLNNLREATAPDKSKHDFKLVGPTRSDILKTILAVTDTLQFDIFSPWSTVHPTLLQPNSDATDYTYEHEKDRWTWKGQFERHAIFRTTPTDLDMLELIASELRLRDVNIDTPKGQSTDSNMNEDAAQTTDTVVIISEWDRIYGRRMPMTFALASGLKDLDPESLSASDWSKAATDAAADSLPPTLRYYSYLQGLDGIVPEKGGAAASKDSQVKRKDIIRPEGSGQLDYIRRLAGQLRHEEPTLGGSDIKAIGVLGSDVYDKLLVLQALRDVFPHVIFFTTDLDARLVQSSEQKWARNLIVASGYGLNIDAADDELNTVSKPGEPRLPPFRGAYMQAIYQACRRAVSNLREVNRIEPKLFEIGRTRAIQIEPRELSSDDRVDNWPWHILVFCLLLGLLFFVVARLRCDFEHLERRRIAASMVAPLVCVLIAWLIWLSVKPAGNPWDEEPFFFLEGISIWPTELVRLLAGVLAVEFMIQMAFTLRADRKKLSYKFRLPAKEKIPDNWRHSIRDAVRIVSRTWPRSGGELQVAEVWKEYLRLGRCQNRVGRVAVFMVIYMMLAWLVFMIAGSPVTPVRGPHSMVWDKVVLIISVLPMLVLVFFVVDATLLCRRFIQKLSRRRSRWPEPALGRAASMRRLDENLASEWLDISLIARRTRTIGRFVVYPFVVLFLMIISRNPFFDRWSWPLSLVFVFTFNSCFAIMSAIVMRRAAENARRRALRRLRGYEMVSLGDGDEKHAGQARALIAEITALHEGAFAPLSRNPLFGAIIMPFGGISLAVLLEMFSGAG